jgi:LPXTG-motif cell wall-anchored protein
MSDAIGDVTIKVIPTGDGNGGGNGEESTKNLLIIGAGVTAVAIGAMVYFTRKKR